MEKLGSESDTQLILIPMKGNEGIQETKVKSSNKDWALLSAYTLQCYRSARGFPGLARCIGSYFQSNMQMLKLLKNHLTHSSSST